MRRPNFILFITDQQRADFLGCYGHPVLKTPHIDALAARGVKFDRFYVTSPVCIPNRASLMTCRMPSSHGVWTNGVPLDQDHVTFVELLRDAGYQTALIGKSHLQTFAPVPPQMTGETPSGELHVAEPSLRQARRSAPKAEDYNLEQPAFWQEPGNELPTPFYGFEHTEIATGHGDRLGGSYARWLHSRVENPERLLGPANQLPHDYTCPQAVRTALPEELYSTSYIAERACDWIAGHAGDDAPFFLMVSFPDPHHPFNPPGKYWDMYDPTDMETPAAFSVNDWQPPAYVAEAMRKRAEGMVPEHGFLSLACTEQEAREARALTCGMISMIDDAIGRVMATLSETGRADETVAIFTSDHGDHLGDHQLLFKGPEQYEQITRVAMIWADPEADRQTGKGHIDGIGQTHDIGVTILERARIAPAHGMQGQSLLAGSGALRQAALIQYDQQDAVEGYGDFPSVHTYRDARWRLSIFNGVAGGELFDLVHDPYEFTNLWDDPLAQDDKVRLLEAMLRLQISVTDRMPLPTGMA
jgi:arylsulfatase A-like enzyme